MAEIRHFPRSGFPATRQNVAPQLAPAQDDTLSVEKFSVYNQTQACFIASNLEAVDASAGEAEARLRSLGSEPEAGLWILPCPEMTPASVRVPVDLVYLHNDGTVLTTIKSFPLSHNSGVSVMAWSLLVLPADTLTRAQVLAGDRLLIAAPETLKLQLQGANQAGSEAGEAATAAASAQAAPPPQGDHWEFLQQFARAPGSLTAAPVDDDWPRYTPAPRSAEPVEAVPAGPAIAAARAAAAPPPAELLTTEPVSAEPLAAEPPLAAAPHLKEKAARNWFTRLVLGDPADPADARKALRESLPGLIAYFFTGGTPIGEAVRDISATGMYMVTSHRWYHGTVVRITLTDRQNPIAERSITVNAKAMRDGSDGVGLRFILEGKNRRKGPAQVDERTGVDQAQMEEFLRQYKEASKQV